MAFLAPPNNWTTICEQNCANWEIDVWDLCCILVFLGFPSSRFFLGLFLDKGRPQKTKLKSKSKKMNKNKTRSKQAKSLLCSLVTKDKHRKHSNFKTQEAKKH